MEKMNWSKLMIPQRLGEKSGAQVGGENRSLFEQDYDRVIFSQPFRQLQDKTQVVPLPVYDFVHTRLTHSLEVSCVGRSLGREAGSRLIEKYGLEDVFAFDFGAVVAAASLAHDIGNPPFGHSGEEAISGFFRDHMIAEPLMQGFHPQQIEDLKNFEGNAQGFRLLTQPGNKSLNLSLPALAAFTKYPRPSTLMEGKGKRKSARKFGYYHSEASAFEQLAKKLGLLSLDHGAWCRHPLTFLVEAADDICYHIIDLEDGFHQGWVSFEEAWDLLAQVLGADFDRKKLEKVRFKAEQISYLRAVAISRLIRSVTRVFLQKEEEMLSGDFDAALLSFVPEKKAMDEIIRISIQKIYRSRQVLETEIAGFEVLQGLMEAFAEALAKQVRGKGMSRRHRSILHLLPESIQYRLEQNGAEALYESLRSILDFISGLTDTYALSLYRKIKGISLPGRN